MLNTALLSFCLYLIALTHVESTENCDELGILLYEDVGCKPIKKEGKRCPIKYECEFGFKNGTCLFRNHYYSQGEGIQREDIAANCYAGCFCSQEDRFTCAVLDCVEFFGPPVDPHCYRTYNLDKCCSVGQKCPSEGETVGECLVDGQKFREGERFYPKNTCTRCICPKNFNGKYKAPYCKRSSCAVQVRSNVKYQQKCAPFYQNRESTALCCPSDWICPTPGDKIITINEKADKNSDLACQFGETTVKLGQGLEREVNRRLARCECVIPPLLTCKEI